MKKLLFIAGVVIVSGIAYWMVSPLLYDVEVSESVEEISVEGETSIIGKGMFSGLAGHSAQGTAQLVRKGEEHYVRFESDFDVTNGPDLFVYLGKNGEYAPEAVLGSLKGTIGSQNYLIPLGIDVNQYDEVWVWCRAFSVPFGKAEIRPIE
ncbi:MAG: DM13 domain-containing protein [bacterium]|nr:DM13 domain-containing protein [bacterium]